MNQRDSSGLPLRAMVMVLLFLGAIFLLVGFQALRSDGDSDTDDSSATTVVSTPSAAPATSKKPAEPEKSDVRVFNISDIDGAAEGTATRLRDAGWNVTDTGNLTLEGVTATTVYFSEAPGEQASAEDVGKLLEAPVEPRLPALAEEPPGVIVAVTG